MNTISKLLFLVFTLVVLNGCTTAPSYSSIQPELVRSKTVGTTMRCRKNSDGTIDQTSCVPSNKGPEIVSEQFRVKMPSEYCGQYNTPETQQAYTLCVERVTNELNTKAAGTYGQERRQQYAQQQYAVIPGTESIIPAPQMFSGAPIVGYGGYNNYRRCGLLSWIFSGGCQNGSGYYGGYNADIYDPNSTHFGITIE